MVILNPQSNREFHFFETDDRVKLHYQETGNNNCERTVLLLPGWSQTSNQYEAQIRAFAENGCHVVALDPRGHGRSDSAPLGTYSIRRLAMDVKNLLEHLNLSRKVDVVAHSASCSVLWEFLEMLGLEQLQESFQSIVFVDQGICFSAQPHWSKEECLKVGAGSTDTERIVQDMIKPDGEHVRRKLLSTMFTENMKEKDFEKVVQLNLQFPNKEASEMIGNVLSGDYRATLPKISGIPCLCIGATDSLIPAQCLHHMASQIPNAESIILKGNHFMFLEDPVPFNQVVLDFFWSQQERGRSATPELKA